VFYIGLFHSIFDHAPKHGVVEVVDVAIDLSPPEVILNDLEGWVLDNPGVKGRELGERSCREEMRPVVDISRCEAGDQGGLDLVDATIEQLGVLCKHERVLIGLSVGHEYLFEARADMQSGFVHQFDRSEVVGFFKGMGGTEFGE
jgi:hypothetical protein